MKYARKLSAIIVAYVLLIISVMPALLATATAQGGLSLSPPLQEVTLGPGLLQASVRVTFKNNTDSSVRASYKLVDLKALGEFGGTSLAQAGLPDAYNLANWMSLPDGDNQTINGNETATIKVHIDNKTDLSPGGHYGALLITTTPEGADSKQVSLNQQMVSLIFVKKLGGETYGLELESFSPDKPLTLPDSVTLHFKGTGNVHVTPRGYIEIKDNTGAIVSKGIINPDSSLVMPEASRRFITMMKPVSGIRPGNSYTMTIYYRYDGQDQFDSRSVSFSFKPTPKRLAIFAVGGLVAVVGLVLAGREGYHAHKKFQSRGAKK